MSQNKELKEHNVPIILKPKFNYDCSELIFFLPGSLLIDIRFKNYFLSNNEKPTTNYKSIHFIINGKELNEEEIQNFSLCDENNGVFNLWKTQREIFNIYYHVKVILNHPINPDFNFPRLNLTRVIQSTQEIKYL